MKEVSIFDHTITAIREGRMSKEEVAEILQELWAVYPELFEQLGMDGNMEQEGRPYDETLLDRDSTGQRPY